MKFVADLHLHSKYSRAVSQQMVLSQMALWAKYKGINVLATGDFTHPFWFETLKNELEEVGNGLLRLKTNDTSASLSANQRLKPGNTLDVSPSALDKQVIYFLLSCEIASIYSQGDKVRRIHTLFFFPSLKSVEAFNKKLLDRGANLRADGRPIVGINSRDLAQLALEVSEKVLIIPAHIWTPWFSIFGSFSGFDSIEECFGDLAPYIYGIETGLSSDPAMNWQIADLDMRSILSFSDAHSLEKMGREATVFEAEDISYDSICKAIAGPVKNSGKLGKLRDSENQNVRISGKSDNPTRRRSESSEHSDNPRIAFTIEFYPEEGKYHFDGHRNCKFSQSPEETKKNGSLCPVCRKPLTIGVMNRVEDLKVRTGNWELRTSNGVRWIVPKGSKRPSFVSLVPLGEIIAEVFESAVKTKKVFEVYETLVSAFGSEFGVLLKAPVGEIAKVSSAKIAESIAKVRRGEIEVKAGFDGEYGVVKIWPEENQQAQNEQSENQLNLFA